jgi:hypothetical protein
MEATVRRPGPRTAARRASVDEQRSTVAMARRKPSKEATRRADVTEEDDLKRKVWEAYDVFLTLGTQHKGEFVIMRTPDGIDARPGNRTPYETFVKRAPELEISVPVLRILRRTKLYERLRECSEPVTVLEFFRRAFPHATDAELDRFQYWSVLRVVKRTVSQDGYTGSNDDMLAVFDALDFDRDGLISAEEFSAADMLNPDEMEKLRQRLENRHHGVDFEEFKHVVWPMLVTKYVSQETKAHLEKERMRESANRVTGAMQKRFSKQADHVAIIEPAASEDEAEEPADGA